MISQTKCCTSPFHFVCSLRFLEAWSFTLDRATTLSVSFIQKCLYKNSKHDIRQLVVVVTKHFCAGALHILKVSYVWGNSMCCNRTIVHSSGQTTLQKKGMYLFLLYPLKSSSQVISWSHRPIVWRSCSWRRPSKRPGWTDHQSSRDKNVRWKRDEVRHSTFVDSTE